MAEQAGRLVLINVDTNDTGGGTATWATIGQQRGGSLARTTETADATHKDNSGWASAVITRKGWSVSVDGALDPADTAWTHLLAKWANQEKPYVQVDASGITGETVEGQVIINTLDYDFPENDLVTFTIEGTGDGALTTSP